MNGAYKYAKWALTAPESPKYVRMQCEEFCDIWNGKDKRFCIDKPKMKQMENILKLLVMPKGVKQGTSLFECSFGYQWLLYVAIFCIVWKDRPLKRRYETVLLEICRKNAKTFTSAVIMILLMVLEPSFSRFFSVAPDGTLSREVKLAMEEILKCSPLIFTDGKGAERWKLLKDSSEFLLKENTYIPLNYSNSRLDGRLPNAFICDETGALPNSYAIEAMRSGQLQIINKLGIIISTKYPNTNNPFEDEVKYAKRVLDKTVEDDSLFSLLYEPDNTDEWMTDDLIMKQSNPAALDVDIVWQDLLNKRARAIEQESARENFLTKHCNIIYTGASSESFVDVGEVKKCKVDYIDWRGKGVYLGVDLAMSNDNCAVSMLGVDEEDNILLESFAFVPEGRVEEKTRAERCDYPRYIRQGKCFACGYKTVDYAFIEQFVFGIEEKYGVEIMGIGFDRWNCLSSAQKWEQKYNVVEVRQHSDTLHPTTKLLYEKIVNHQLKYADNDLLEINFGNARCSFDTNMNRYVSKKKSNGKIDMIAATLDGLHLLNTEVLMGTEDNFFVQII